MSSEPLLRLLVLNSQTETRSEGENIMRNSKNQKRGRCGVLVAATLFVLTGCGDKAEMSSAKQEAQVASMPMAGNVSTPDVTARAAMSVLKAPAAAGSTSDRAGAEGKNTLTLVSLTDSQPDRYLIKNATISIETLDVRKVAEQLIAFARTTRGYVSDSHESVDGLGARSITMQLRVPATQFDASMQEIEGLGKILDKQVNTEDVTEEFVDSQARVRNLKSTELRLLAHLSKTGKLSDTLLIENELTRVRQQIEQIEGRLKFLAHRVAYSTFSITVHETPKMQTVLPAQTFSSGKVASDAARSLFEFGQNLWSVAIWVGIWAAVWLPGVLMARAMLVRRKREVSPLPIRPSPMPPPGMDFPPRV
jgi:hypothetical protein